MNYVAFTNEVSNILFEYDPANTCCVENECYDEYDLIAEDATKMIRGGWAVDESVLQALDHAFGNDWREPRFQEMSNKIARLYNKYCEDYLNN